MQRPRNCDATRGEGKEAAKLREPSSRRGNGRSSLGRLHDLDQQAQDALDRRNILRGLSKWRRDARQDERREAWPVQVTGLAT